MRRAIELFLRSLVVLFSVCLPSGATTIVNLDLSSPPLASPPFVQVRLDPVSNATQGGIRFEAANLVLGTFGPDFLFNVRDGANSFIPIILSDTSNVFNSFQCNCGLITSEFGFFDYRVVPAFQATSVIFSVFAADGSTNLTLTNFLVPSSGGVNPQFMEAGIFFPSVPTTVAVAGSTVVPEPSPIALLLPAMAVLVWRASRRRKP